MWPVEPWANEHVPAFVSAKGCDRHQGHTGDHQTTLVHEPVNDGATSAPGTLTYVWAR
jgi:hypothetical protein